MTSYLTLMDLGHRVYELKSLVVTKKSLSQINSLLAKVESMDE